MPESDPRLTELRHWLTTLALPGLDEKSLTPASADASFRRYFRIATGAGTRIVMDAPPPAEDTRPFLHAATVLRDAGVRVPAVHAADQTRGFLLLDDLGSTTMLAQLQTKATQSDPAQAEALYAAASRQLITLQSASYPDAFAPYDRTRLLTELRLFDEWYLGAHHGMALSNAQSNALKALYETLLANNLAQASVFVHRDWHSRNLMTVDGTPAGEAPELAVIDFQDALYGPVTYDLVSLLRDAYIDWSEEVTLDRAIRHWQAARIAGIPVPADFGNFYRDFEWMGLQRHLKVLGIFARLAIRDGKPAYLGDMPRVLAYVQATARRYREFSPLHRLLSELAGTPLRAAFTF